MLSFQFTQRSKKQSSVLDHTMWSALNMHVKKPAPRQLAQGRGNIKQTCITTLFLTMAPTPSLQRLFLGNTALSILTDGKHCFICGSLNNDLVYFKCTKSKQKQKKWTKLPRWQIVLYCWNLDTRQTDRCNCSGRRSLRFYLPQWHNCVVVTWMSNGGCQLMWIKWHYPSALLLQPQCSLSANSTLTIQPTFNNYLVTY